MDIYRLSIPDNGSGRRIQVLDYVNNYVIGDNRLEKIEGKSSLEDLNRAIGEFALSSVKDDEIITGILAFEDGFGDFIDGIIISNDGTLKKVTYAFQDRYFEMAVNLSGLYKSIDPYNGENSVIGCLQLLHNEPMGVISGLIRELYEREV